MDDALLQRYFPSQLLPGQLCHFSSGVVVANAYWNLVQVTEGRLDEAISTVRDQCLSKHRECKNHNEALQNKINKLQQEKDQVKVGLNSFGQSLEMVKER